MYSTSRTDKLLQVSAIAKWIFNAILYAVVICLVSYLILAPTFHNLSLYVAGTLVFTGLCMSLQAKVAFFHHQWAYPNVLAMLISVLGMILYFLLIAVVMWDYYYVSNETYEEPIYWYYGMFSIPLIAVFIDWVDYFVTLIMHPTEEMMFREVQCKVGSFPSSVFPFRLSS